MADVYDRTKLGAWLQENRPDLYGPSSPLKIVSVNEPPNGCVIVSKPADFVPPTLEELDARTPSPVPAVKEMLIAREQVAASKIQALKAACAVALMAGGMSESATMAAGSQLVLDHAAKIQAYILAGGNPVAGQALIDEILAAPPTWWSPQMLALFEAELL